MTDFAENPAHPIKLRAVKSAQGVDVRLLINHPMETGRRKDPQGQVLPAHYIRTVMILRNAQPVCEMQWGTGIAKDPYLALVLTDANIGDDISVIWQDNLGKSGSAQTKVAANW